MEILIGTDQTLVIDDQGEETSHLPDQIRVAIETESEGEVWVDIDDLVEAWLKQR